MGKYVFSGTSSSGGRYTFGGSSVGNISPVPPSTGPAGPPPDAGGGILGLIGNTFEGVIDLGKGIGSLLGSGVHDIGQATGLVDDESGYRIDDILKGLVGVEKEGSLLNPLDWHPMAETALVGDIVNRYSPLMPGGEPASKTFESFYENPVPFLLDAAAVGSAGAKIASVAGKSRIAGNAAAKAAADAAFRELAGEVSSRTARAASIRKGLEVMGEGESLTAKLLPKVRPKLTASGEFLPSTSAYNPLYRAVAAPVRRYGLTRSIDDIRAERTARYGEFDAMPGDVSAPPDITLLDEIIRKAEENDLARVETPRVAQLTTRFRSGKMLAQLKSRQYTARDAELRKRLRTLERYVKEDPTILERAGTTIQGLHVGIEDLRPEHFAVRDKLLGTGPSVRLGEPEVAAIGGGGVAAAVRQGVTPEIRAAAGEGLTTRTDAAIAKIREFQEYVTRNREQMLDGGWTPEKLQAELDGADRLARGLEDGLVRLGRHARPDDPMQVDAGVRWADEARLEEVEEMMDGFTNPVGMTPLDILDRAYRPLRAKYGLNFDWKAEQDLRNAQHALVRAKKELREKTTTRRQQKVTDAEEAVREAQGRVDRAFTGGPALEAVDDALHDAGIAQPVYFPHVDATKMKASDFFTSRRPVGANIFAKDPHNEMMRLTLLRDGTWEKNPIEVIKRRAARSVRESETLKLWEQVTRHFGREISDPSQVPTGFKLVAPDLLFVNSRTRRRLLDRIDEELTNGADRDTAVARALKETIDANYDEVRRLQEAGDVKMWAVPEVVLKRLDEAARWSPAFGGKNARLYMDTPMNVWRGLTLTASPRWIMNNVLGNTAFALMQGAKVGDVVRIGGSKFKTLMHNWYRRRTGLPEIVGPRERSLAAQAEQLTGHKDVGHGYIGTYAEEPSKNLGRAAAETAMGKAIIRARETKAAGLTRRWGDAVKSLNATIEDSFREASYLAAAEKGQMVSGLTRTARSFWGGKKRIAKIMEDGFDEASARAALDEVNRFFGNYGSMTPFERHVIRRWLFPFWGFYRFSTKLIATFPVEYPGRAEILQSLANLHEEMMAEHGELPDWLETSIPLGPPGTNEFMTTRGMNPFSGIAEGIEGPLAMLGPIPKTAIEMGLGRDLFTGREFTDADVVQPFGSDQQYRIIYDDAGNPVGAEPIERVSPGLMQGLLSQIPQYDAARELLAGGRPYDTASLFDALQQRLGREGEATPIDPETGQPYSPASVTQTAGMFAGLPTTTYDVASFQERMAEEREAVIREALRRAGQVTVP